MTIVELAVGQLGAKIEWRADGKSLCDEYFRCERQDPTTLRFRSIEQRLREGNPLARELIATLGDDGRTLEIKPGDWAARWVKEAAQSDQADIVETLTESGDISKLFRGLSDPFRYGARGVRGVLYPDLIKSLGASKDQFVSSAAKAILGHIESTESEFIKLADQKDIALNALNAEMRRQIWLSFSDALTYEGDNRMFETASEIQDSPAGQLMQHLNAKHIDLLARWESRKCAFSRQVRDTFPRHKDEIDGKDIGISFSVNAEELGTIRLENRAGKALSNAIIVIDWRVDKVRYRALADMKLRQLAPLAAFTEILTGANIADPRQIAMAKRQFQMGDKSRLVFVREWAPKSTIEIALCDAWKVADVVDGIDVWVGTNDGAVSLAPKLDAFRSVVARKNPEWKRTEIQLEGPAATEAARNISITMNDLPLSTSLSFDRNNPYYRFKLEVPEHQVFTVSYKAARRPSFAWMAESEENPGYPKKFVENSNSDGDFITALRPGTYYLHVHANMRTPPAESAEETHRRYKAGEPEETASTTVRFTLSSSQARTSLVTDPGGESATAFVIGDVKSFKPMSETVGGEHDPVDVYLFEVPSDGNLKVTLTGLKGAMSLRLGQGHQPRVNEVAMQFNEPGAAELVLQAEVSSGKYYIEVMNARSRASLPYTLQIEHQAAGDPVDNPTP